MKQHPPALIEATANAIKDQFIPKNEAEQVFSFHFTIPPSANYKATYKKDDNGNWFLQDCLPDKLDNQS